MVRRDFDPRLKSFTSLRFRWLRSAHPRTPSRCVVRSVWSSTCHCVHAGLRRHPERSVVIGESGRRAGDSGVLPGDTFLIRTSMQLQQYACFHLIVVFQKRGPLAPFPPNWTKEQRWSSPLPWENASQGTSRGLRENCQAFRRGTSALDHVWARTDRAERNHTPSVWRLEPRPSLPCTPCKADSALHEQISGREMNAQHEQSASQKL